MDAQETHVYIAIIAALVVLGSILSYFLYYFIRNHKKVFQLQRENSKAQIEILEKDRSRIASDLHDDLAPMLSAVQLQIQALEFTNDNDKELQSRTDSTINDISSRMRTIAFDLMPTTLQQKGLQAAIQEFANYVSRNNTLKIDFDAPNQAMNLNEQSTIHVYRIVQEIIHNTMKHAKATELRIELNKEKNYLVLATSDNGIGFDHRQQLKNSNGLGLKSMMNRIYLLQAEFLMDSKPGKGTSITIRIPQQND